MKQIRTVNLSKTYRKGKYPALDDLNLEIEKNSIFGFLGPNGAGKTTAIKLVTGLMRPSRGEVWIGDRKMSTNGGNIHHKIGYLSQSPRYYEWMTAVELLRMVGLFFDLSKVDSEIRADELLELAGLKEHKDRRIATYSGGMVQRLGIAQALIGRPDILFLDEPVSDMDPIGRKEVLEFIRALRGKVTVLMSSHILQDVERVCDTVGIINTGRLIRVAETKALKNEFSSTNVMFSFQEKVETDACEIWLKSRLHTSMFNRDKSSFTLQQGDFSPIKSGFLHWVADNCSSLENLQMITPTLEDVFVTIIGGDNERPDPFSSIA